MAVKLLNIQRGSSKLPSSQKQPNEASFTEQNIYEIIKGHPGFPQVYWTGVQDGYYAIVMELLGTDLYELLRFCDCKFGLQTTLQLGVSMLDRVHALHKLGVLHNDVKPLNFTIGRDKQCSSVYLIDYGMAEQLDFDSSLNAYLPKSFGDGRFVGTLAFQSVATHRRQYRSFSDDLESVAYCLAFFLTGALRATAGASCLCAPFVAVDMHPLSAHTGAWRAVATAHKLPGGINAQRRHGCRAITSPLCVIAQQPCHM